MIVQFIDAKARELLYVLIFVEKSMRKELKHHYKVQVKLLEVHGVLVEKLCQSSNMWCIWSDLSLLERSGRYRKRTLH